MPYPQQLARLHAALESLPGLTRVSSGIQSLQGVSAEHLRFPDSAALPIGAIRRTNGGLNAEALIQVEFWLNASANSWRVIEFLAWFVRDQSRSGAAIQLRPFALPPEAAGQIQLGHTLRWQIDLFCQNTGTDITPQLAQVDHIAHTLELAIQVYSAALNGDLDA